MWWCTDASVCVLHPNSGCLVQSFCFDPPGCFQGLCIWSRIVGSKSSKLWYVLQIVTTATSTRHVDWVHIEASQDSMDILGLQWDCILVHWSHLALVAWVAISCNEHILIWPPVAIVDLSEGWISTVMPSVGRIIICHMNHLWNPVPGPGWAIITILNLVFIPLCKTQK